MAQELVIYCDESEKRGSYFSNFYGGALLRSTDLEPVKAALEEKKQELNFKGEVKFQKITKNYEQKYIDLMNAFFDFIENDKIKIRIMFTQNYYIPSNLDAYQRENEYFMLYYQFIKHAFGLRYANNTDEPLGIRLLLDQLPDTKEKANLFKNHIIALSENRQLRESQIMFRKDQIAEVTSHDHVILQCLDVVLGAMQFRLNDKHKEKPPGARQRAKRTRAKEQIYKAVHKRIRILHKNFNIGISTGKPHGPESLWIQPYRHWLFVPSNHSKDENATKR